MSPCLLYDGYIAPNGYGKRGHVYAHREAYERAYGPIPDGFQVDHLCFTKACVNPEHLEAVTPAENVRRGAHRHSRPQRTRYCPRGHDKDETGRTPHGSCLVCAYARTAAYNRERRRSNREKAS